jgi:hypothetical protein
MVISAVPLPSQRAEDLHASLVAATLLGEER